MRLLSGILAAIMLAACASGVRSSGALPDSLLPGADILSVASPASSSSPPVVGGCQMFPKPAAKPTGESWFNVDISKYPVSPYSSTWISNLPGNLHPDFGRETYYGIPFNVVPENQPLVPVKFLNYPASSNPGPYPIPPNAQIEGYGGPSPSQGDRHVLVLQEGKCKLYEMWQGVRLNGGKSWEAANGAVFDLNTGALRPRGWTSADAAGLPITPALIKCAEVQAGAIDHAMRITFNSTQGGYILPATHEAGSPSDTNLPPMGARVRLKASFDISHYNRVSKIILTAMKKYGLFVADNGSNWFFQGQGGTAAKCWNDNILNQLKNVPGTAFEFVNTGPIHSGD